MDGIHTIRIASFPGYFLMRERLIAVSHCRASACGVPGSCLTPPAEYLPSSFRTIDVSVVRDFAQKGMAAVLENCRTDRAMNLAAGLTEPQERLSVRPRDHHLAE
jgi:hypothetical protein